ncbi:MAG: sensor histidine kinase [Gemmatimonadaceae bacterium]|nr:sensor histidine kinase [Gemmatimonadaceae bacterium]
MPSWLLALLRVPLIGKLIGANVLIAGAVCGAATLMHQDWTSETTVLVVSLLSLLGVVLVNIGLVMLALRPLADLESTAKRIWRGDVSARVPESLLADRDLQRVGGALNALLDGLTADRERLRELAARVIRAGDEERSYIARELHDSSAQSLAALLMELSVVIRETDDPAAVERLQRIRRIAGDVLDEVRMLAQAVHPRVLDDLGLGAALQHLVREAETRSAVRLEVVVEDSADEVSSAVSSVLYRLAQEALNNALRHANATTVMVRAGVVGNVARVEIVDDGIGFHPVEAERRRPGMGLFTRRERIALLDGALEIESAPGRGTRITARVPLLARTNAQVTSASAGT